MANEVYPKAKEAMLSGDVDLLSSTVRLQMYADDAEYDATDQFLDDVVGTKLGAAVAINSKDVSNGQFTGSNGVFSPPDGQTVSSIVVYIDSGSDATSRLLAWLDTKADTTALTFTSTGVPVQPFWNDPYFSIGG